MAKTTNDTKTERPSNETLGIIDPHDVFGEVERLAQTYGATTDHLLFAMQRLTQCKAHLEAVEASLDLSTRKSAEITGEKITERKVKSAIEATDQWRTARTLYDQAELAVEQSKYALKTLDKKDRMIELLARVQIRELGVNSRTQ